MVYVPHTDADRRAMLEAIGVARVEDLFDVVPAVFRFPTLDLPEPLSELEILEELQALSECNFGAHDYACFLGAGAYRHFVPSVVDHIISRSEFFTAYTPYQPEISQGTLQAIFEYQSMICALTGMEAANASHYDGATAMAEAVIAAINVARGRRKKVVLSPCVHPEHRQVVRTYTQGMGLTVVEDRLPGLASFGFEALKEQVDGDTACLIVQNPDFLGRLASPAELQALADAAHAAGALFVVSADPISLGLFKAPGEYGADIVVGEGQALGGGLNFGGPYLGFFACKKSYVHKMAGRLVGQTVDADGQRGFVLTLSAREQHIRREKATSNICTNQALCALAACVYLAVMGKHGLRQVAELCYHRAHYAADRIKEVPGFVVHDEKPFFKEFVVQCPRPPAEINEALLDFGIIGGYELKTAYPEIPELKNAMLLCVTEMNSGDEIDWLVESLREVIS